MNGLIIKVMPYGGMLEAHSVHDGYETWLAAAHTLDELLRMVAQNLGKPVTLPLIVQEQ